jgi:allantoicase
LAEQGTIERVLVDTTHFKGNAPESCEIEVCDVGDAPLEGLLRDEGAWTVLLPRTKLLAHTPHWFDPGELRTLRAVTHARIKIFPEGGVSRLRLLGSVTRQGREQAGLRRFNRLLPRATLAALRACCGSTRWCEQMAASRPFASFAALLKTADTVWQGLGPADWQEAFAAHPKIGERATSNATRAWSEQEQAGVQTATADALSELSKLNLSYQERFGYIFIVCATGKSSEQMLSMLRERVQNDPAKELTIAAEEHRKITALRVEKWVVG